MGDLELEAMIEANREAFEEAQQYDVEDPRHAAVYLRLAARHEAIRDAYIDY